MLARAHFCSITPPRVSITGEIWMLPDDGSNEEHFRAGLERGFAALSAATTIPLTRDRDRVHDTRDARRLMRDRLRRAAF
jgi:hypothetical protein